MLRKRFSNSIANENKLTKIISPIFWSVFELWRELYNNVESFGYNNGLGFIGNKIL